MNQLDGAASTVAPGARVASAGGQTAGRPGRIGWGLWTVLMLSLLIGLVSYRYLIPGVEGLPPFIVANRFTHAGMLTMHAGFAATALILGPFQFMTRLRRARPRLHRGAGLAYIGCCLVGGLAGFVLALGTTAGPIASAGFGLLGVSWVFITAKAWRLATIRQVAAHERWMIRSFALTMAALTLRFYTTLAWVLAFDPMDSYRAISFLAWVPNLIAAELFLARRQRA